MSITLQRFRAEIVEGCQVVVEPNGTWIGGVPGKLQLA